MMSSAYIRHAVHRSLCVKCFYEISTLRPTPNSFHIGAPSSTAHPDIRSTRQQQSSLPVLLVPGVGSRMTQRRRPDDDSRRHRLGPPPLRQGLGLPRQGLGLLRGRHSSLGLLLLWLPAAESLRHGTLEGLEGNLTELTQLVLPQSALEASSLPAPTAALQLDDLSRSHETHGSRQDEAGPRQDGASSSASTQTAVGDHQEEQTDASDSKWEFDIRSGTGVVVYPRDKVKEAGCAYIMFTGGEDVHTGKRFKDARMALDTAHHFVVVRHNDAKDAWEFGYVEKRMKPEDVEADPDSGDQATDKIKMDWVKFDPKPEDRLMAKVPFDDKSIVSFEDEYTTLIHGIKKGYKEGSSIQFDDTEIEGEISITGDGFDVEKADETEEDGAAAAANGVAQDDIKLAHLPKDSETLEEVDNTVDRAVFGFYFLVPFCQVVVIAALVGMGMWKRRVQQDTVLAARAARKSERSEDSDSEDEDLLGYSFEENNIVQVGLGGIDMKFMSDKIEEKFSSQNLRRGISVGCRILIVVSVLIIINKLWLLYKGSLCNRDPGWKYFEVGAIMVVLIVTAACSQLESFALYVTILVFYFFYMLARAVDPLKYSCDDLKELSFCTADPSTWRRLQESDCSVLGHTAQQGLITWLLLLPWTIPTYSQIHFVWIFVFFIYTPFMMNDKVYSASFHKQEEMAMSVVLMTATVIISTMKKFSLEMAYRLSYIGDIKQKKASKRMFNIFEFMVPQHVIGRMLKSPGTPIADPVPRVSILFIMIVDFEARATSMKPTELLAFLNEQFMEMDRVMLENRVTKVETVGEEYVACVGAVPEDMVYGQANGHGKIASRLLKAADEILQLQTGDVSFQMGMHSGPIVAGVIGNKLPRYRLFGDTINTTARFMQKGVPKKLQMSEEVHKELLPGIQVEYRGKVEMKGKGEVDAWLLGGGSVGSTVSAVRSVKSREEAADGEDAAEGGNEGPPQPTVGSSFQKVGEALAGGFKNSLLSKLVPSSSQGNASNEEEDKDEENDADFEKVLKEMRSEDDEKAKTEGQLAVWVDSLHEKMAPEVEGAWIRWSHREDVCKNMLVRLDKQMLLLAILTLIETYYLCRTKAWQDDHKHFPGWLRIPIFQACRTAAFLVLIFWRASMVSVSMALQSPKVLQGGIAFSHCLVALFIFFSYSVMTLSDKELLLPPGDLSFQEQTPDEKKEMRWEQMFALGFVLVFYLITTAETFSFLVSLCVPLLSLTLMGATVNHGFGTLFFHNEGRFLFVANAAMISFIAYEWEQSSRKRFKAKYAVELTERRVEVILNTLLPPMVMEELKCLPPGAPPPSHYYRAATIAQSDMCGFTQLAATRQPHEVVAFMGDLFGRFDDLCDDFGIYKIETIGDAYIAGQAEHTLTRQNSTISVIRFGLAMIDAVGDWARGMGVDVTCRVGIHHGDCVGGIVGTGMMRYHLFGKLMAMIEILESTAPKGQVQISPACKGKAEYDCGPDGKDEPGGGLIFKQREEDKLYTSKGIAHECSEVGGRTWIVHRPGAS
eukprot:TRINITY_DN36385_c5_g1_i1.p1 TRINITY_DN36385_c5_g1~~TRINITY_DN36385_c5_g1_i1.p1  ORF type:complete len:1519 (-),score=397.12 TRINITY_DN36385_c5_g1_i1:137-4693(-)